jgi:hypothetical protein
MSRKWIGLLILSFCLACAKPPIKYDPAVAGCFQSLSIKFNFSDSQGKQNGRCLWRFDDRNAKFIFFTPLNQIALELDVAGESALLLRPGKKLYWRGDFSTLLDRLWGIDLTLEDLKLLVVDGVIPEAKTKEKGIAVLLETGREDLSPRWVNIKRNDVDLTLKILKNETRPGTIVLLNYDRRFQPAQLEDVLGDD